jgi:FAD:protein FMN transferase
VKGAAFAGFETVARFLPWLWAMALVVLLGACASPAPIHRQEAYVFGTRVDILVYGGEAALAHAAIDRVLAEFDRLHRAYHAWEPSELTALNDALAKGEVHTVSEELARMLLKAQAMADKGGGLFDPALGQLIAAWGFHASEFVPTRPDPALLARIKAADPRMAHLKIEGHQVSSPNKAVRIDLGGYAKGFALDRAAQILKENGIHHALINIGGNLLALGRKGKDPWRVGIQHPREPRPLATLPLYDGEAIGTSGDYQRYFELDGVRYSHLIDPRTGVPATGTQSVTVLVSPQPQAGVLSDAPSKPAFIDPDNWRLHLAAYGIDHGLRVNPEGQIEVTRALRARLKFEPGVGPVRVID